MCLCVLWWSTYVPLVCIYVHTTKLHIRTYSCLHVCMFMYICNIHVCIYVYVCRYVCICTFIVFSHNKASLQWCMHRNIQLHNVMRACVCIHACTTLYMYIYVCTYVYIMHICTYLCIFVRFIIHVDGAMVFPYTYICV